MFLSETKIDEKCEAKNYEIDRYKMFCKDRNKLWGIMLIENY